MPEFLQQHLKPAAMAEALAALLDNPAARARQLSRFAPVRDALRRDAAVTSAAAIAALIDGR